MKIVTRRMRMFQPAVFEIQIDRLHVAMENVFNMFSDMIKFCSSQPWYVLLYGRCTQSIFLAVCFISLDKNLLGWKIFKWLNESNENGLFKICKFVSLGQINSLPSKYKNIVIILLSLLFFLLQAALNWGTFSSRASTIIFVILKSRAVRQH